MNCKHLLTGFAALALAVPLAAQMGMMGQVPTLSGVWHPVVGSGAVYLNTKSDGTKTQIEISVLGKDVDAQGNPGHWVEISMPNPRAGGTIYVKYLTSVQENTINNSHMIVQMPGQDPMDMGTMGAAMGGRMQQKAPSSIMNDAEIVGTDTVTVPAGTFSCTHYRKKGGGAGDEAWISDKVSPWGLVKSQGKDGESIVLINVLSDAKDHITGTPRKFDPSMMMGGRQVPPRQ
jgi:hypothetical protein